VLVAGGFNGTGHILASAELYDPESGNWTATDHLNPRRFQHTATLLLNGDVLVSGGNAANGILARAELYKSAPEGLDIP
jgi:N-acetylneuraminic acid mutarotase